MTVHDKQANGERNIRRIFGERALSSSFASSSDPWSPQRAWGTVILLQLMLAVAVLDRQVTTLLVGPIRADLGITDFQVSILHGFAFAIFYALFGLPIGLLVDKFS